MNRLDYQYGLEKVTCMEGLLSEEIKKKARGLKIQIVELTQEEIANMCSETFVLKHISSHYKQSNENEIQNMLENTDYIESARLLLGNK